MRMNWLFSMRLAFVLLMLLSLWFAIGVGLSEYELYRQVLRALNDLPMSQWLQSLTAAPMVGFWLAGLFGLMFLLGLNTALCSWRDLLPIWRHKRWRSPRIMMLPIHILTLLVFIFHGVDLVFIHGHDSAVLHQGERFNSGRYQIKLVSVDYRDDVSLITEDATGFSPAGRITRRSVEQFDPRINSAYFFVQDGEQKISGDAGFMRPFRWKDLYITVTDFRVPHQEEARGVQVKVLAVHNPLVNYFFACYGLLLVSLLLQGLVFWRRSMKKGGRR
ncbi:hypothetical protein L2719_20430 [Shewanella schlegeliana]|uniref:ResB-like domain-containing protein n=1 Tax=Shewanella schlegeliana TaxID=190308 RepID=A0ABS1SW62_9GAMM|nr:hypothetical protein [Shewanella schlegeliana]MBL4912764.1 hypothetical protein [Shewanella schlegeliana]MCL1111895.1 hypothetical protein [Shewanella schlegeliana]GIU30567.1 hypothetical protein TUM4433_21220 [Shewanella schlegeliana]